MVSVHTLLKMDNCVHTHTEPVDLLVGFKVPAPHHRSGAFLRVRMQCKETWTLQRKSKNVNIRYTAGNVLDHAD